MAKWVAYGIAGTAATIYLHSKLTGFGNPRDWHATYQHPSQNPIQNPPRGNGDPESGGDPNGNYIKAVKWVVGTGLVAKGIDEFNTQMNLIFSNKPQGAPRDNTTVIKQSPHR